MTTRKELSSEILTHFTPLSAGVLISMETLYDEDDYIRTDIVEKTYDIQLLTIADNSLFRAMWKIVDGKTTEYSIILLFDLFEWMKVENMKCFAIAQRLEFWKDLSK